MDKEKTNTTKRVLDVLEYITRNGVSSSVLNVSEALDIPASTVHRILQTMKDEGYVRQTADKR